MRAALFLLAHSAFAATTAQWTISSPSAITLTASAAATDAGKALTCEAAGQVTACILVGLNTTEIPAGVIATVESATDPITLSILSASDASGNAPTPTPCLRLEETEVRTIALLILSATCYGADPIVSALTARIANSGGRSAILGSFLYVDLSIGGGDGYRDVYKCSITGAGVVTSCATCLTCAGESGSSKHHGNPRSDPSGYGVLFQRQHPDSIYTCPGANCSTGSPGSGGGNDFWFYDPASGNITDITGDSVSNIDINFQMHSWFVDANTLAWSHRRGSCTNILGQEYTGCTLTATSANYGAWEIVVADIARTANIPSSLSNLRRYRPNVGTGRDLWFEVNSSFVDADGTWIVASSNACWADQIIPNICLIKFKIKDSGGSFLSTVDAEATAVNLTGDQTETWNEIGKVSPDGLFIYWMTDAGNPYADGFNRDTSLSLLTLRADYWRMNLDGTGKQRLTGWNLPGSTEYNAADVPVIASYINFRNSVSWFGYRTKNGATADEVYQVDLNRQTVVRGRVTSQGRVTMQ